MLRDELGGLVDDLSVSGTMALDDQDRAVLITGNLRRLFGASISPGSPSPLDRMNIPHTLVNFIVHEVHTTTSTGKRRNFSLIVPLADGFHYWMCSVVSTTMPGSKAKLAVVSVYDAGREETQIPKGGGLKVLNGQKTIMLPGSMIVLDRHSLAVRFLNAVAAMSLGNEAEMIGKRLDELTKSPSDEVLQALKEASATGKSVIHTETYNVENARPQFIRWLITSRSTEHGDELVAIVSDVTAQFSEQYRLLSKELQQERNILRTILETIPVGLVITDRSGNIWLSNDLASDVVQGGSAGDEGSDSNGYRGQRTIGEWLTLPRGMEDETVSGDVTTFQTPSGETKVVLVSSAPLRNKDGTLIGRVSALQDITEQKMVERKVLEQSMDLARSNAELQQFAYVASHDLQEPLRMVTTYLGMLERKFGNELSAQAKQYMNYAVDGSMRMKTLIDDLLQYSRIDARSIEISRVDMDELVKTVKDDMHVPIQETDAEIIVHPLPTICADRTQIKQLMMNLISNAIKFRSEARPRVEISAVANENESVFSVKDNGIGIDSKYYDKLFKMFSRLHTMEEYPGTGIGLAISKKIVERHGGRIWFVSEMGKGSTFFFAIPAC